MSKLGKKPLDIPEGVTVLFKDNRLFFKGSNGELVLPILPFLKVDLKDKTLQVSATQESVQARSNWGTMVSLTKNSIEGVQKGFSKKLIIEGIGYGASLEGKNLVMQIGFSHPVRYLPPEGISLTVKKNMITVSGVNKELVGEVAAKIRKFKKPEPYKGKGIRYENEIVRRKAGKKAATATQ